METTPILASLYWISGKIACICSHYFHAFITVSHDWLFTREINMEGEKEFVTVWDIAATMSPNTHVGINLICMLHESFRPHTRVCLRDSFSSWKLRSNMSFISAACSWSEVQEYVEYEILIFLLRNSSRVIKYTMEVLATGSAYIHVPYHNWSWEGL